MRARVSSLAVIVLALQIIVQQVQIWQIRESISGLRENFTALLEVQSKTQANIDAVVATQRIQTDTAKVQDANTGALIGIVRKLSGGRSNE